MKFLRTLLGKPAEVPAQPAAATPAPKPPPPPVNPAPFRQALAAAAGDDARAQAERDLGKALGAAGQAPLPSDPASVWTEAACQATDKALAAAWADAVQGDDPLAEIAIRSRFAEVRLSAARRLSGDEAIDRVAQATRDKDKGVYRHCTDTLRDRRQQAERAKRAAEVSAALESLLASHPLSPSRLSELEKEVRALGESGDDVAACQTLAARGRERIQEEQQQMRDLQIRLAEAESLAGEVKAEPWPTPERIAEWNERLATLTGAAAPDWLSDHANAEAAANALQDIPARLEALAEDRRRIEACEQFLAGLAPDTPPGDETAAAWAALPKPASDQPRQALEARWTAVITPPPPAAPEVPEPPPAAVVEEAPAPDAPAVTGEAPAPDAPAVTGEAPPPDAPAVTGDAPAPDAPAVTGDAPAPDAPAVTGEAPPPDAPAVTGEAPRSSEPVASDESLPPSPAPVAEKSAPPPGEPKPKRTGSQKRPVDMEAVTALLQELDLALDEGRSADADTALKRIDGMLGDTPLHGAPDRRLRRARSQIARLRGWARWGNDQAREHLIEAAEELLRSEPDVDARSQAIPALRAEWKHLDTLGPAAKPQWERFDRAVEKAYEPVAAKRAEDAARHEVARAAKEALLAEWETWLAGIAWDQADYKAVDAKRQDIFARWRAAAMAGFRDERQLRKRLDALIAAIDGHVDGARKAEFARREQLIAAVEALRDTPDVMKAVNETKTLQAKWRDEAGAIRLLRGEEQKLWQRFRGACDGIFTRRDNEKAARTAEHGRRLHTRQSLLDSYQAALDAPGAMLSDIEKASAEFRTAWASAEAPPREAIFKLDARARELEQLTRRRIEALKRDKHQARFALMAQKAALAERAEAAAAAGSASQELIDEARQAAEALPRLSGAAERALAERLAAASGATVEKLAAGREAREAMLLDLEIALGLHSPGALAETRRARQMAKLQDHFGGNAKDAPGAEASVIRWYATAATPDTEQAERVAAIVAALAAREK